MKPIACELWPFKILIEPKYGNPNEAYFTIRNQDFKSKNRYKSHIKGFYIYVNPRCRGVLWGKPSAIFINHVLVEFINIRLGLQRKQHYSTSK
jgi:hypothetical protein